MDFNYVVLKPIFGGKVSNVTNPIFRNGSAVIYLSETSQNKVVILCEMFLDSAQYDVNHSLKTLKLYFVARFNF